MFRSVLFANIEWIIAVVGIIAMMIAGIPSVFLYALMLSALFYFVGLNTFMTCLFSFFLVPLGVFGALGKLVAGGNNSFAYAVAIIVSLAAAIYVAIYVWKNFIDVVDYRMLFRNSASSLYRLRMVYTINRFATTFFGMVFPWIICIHGPFL